MGVKEKERQDKRKHYEHQAAFSVAPGSRVLSVCLQVCWPKGIKFLTALLSFLIGNELLNNNVVVLFSEVSL